MRRSKRERHRDSFGLVFAGTAILDSDSLLVGEAFTSAEVLSSSIRDDEGRSLSTAGMAWSLREK